MFWRVRITQGTTDTTFVFPWDVALGASDALAFALAQLKTMPHVFGESNMLKTTITFNMRDRHG